VEAVGYEAVNATNQTDASITLRQALNVTAPRGGIGIVGLFSGGLNGFDIGQAFEKTIAVDGGVVLPLQVASELVPLITSGKAKPSFIVSSIIDIEEAPEYYARFSRHEETKVVIRL
jgi:threonine dehydrogenase-like Zn-dependent dehydrogenase